MQGWFWGGKFKYVILLCYMLNPIWEMLFKDILICSLLHDLLPNGRSVHSFYNYNLKHKKGFVVNHGPHNWPSSKEIWILWQECDKNTKKSIFSMTMRWRLWEKGNASRSKRWIIDYAALHQQKRHYDFHLILTNWKSCEHRKVLLADVVIKMARLIQYVYNLT